MVSIYDEIELERNERRRRIEARTKWEADRPRRILALIWDVMKISAIMALMYAFIFFSALWASM